MSMDAPEHAEPRNGSTTFRWILHCGWHGLCPRCGHGCMFRSWLKIVDRCDRCGLDYRFAAPADGPAFFSLCIIALPLIAFVVWVQVAFEPPAWVHLVTSLPVDGGGHAVAAPFDQGMVGRVPVREPRAGGRHAAAMVTAARDR